MAMRRMTPRLWILASVALLMVLVGPGISVADRILRRTEAARLVEPTPEEARQALVVMVEQRPEEEQVFFRLDELRAGRALVILDADRDRWYAVDL